MSDAPTVPAATPSASWGDLHVALWNALKLGGSLIGTWTVALAIRFALPRQLGPDQYGVYNFAEAFAASFFVLTTLGVETYVQKEIPLRREHASDFVGGILALRLVLGPALGPDRPGGRIHGRGGAQDLRARVLVPQAGGPRDPPRSRRDAQGPGLQ